MVLLVLLMKNSSTGSMVYKVFFFTIFFIYSLPVSVKSLTKFSIIQKSSDLLRTLPNVTEEKKEKEENSTYDLKTFPSIHNVSFESPHASYESLGQVSSSTSSSAKLLRSKQMIQSNNNPSINRFKNKRDGKMRFFLLNQIANGSISYAK